MIQELEDSSFDFSIRLFNLVRYLQEKDAEFPLSERLLLCGSGIGINLRLSDYADSKRWMEQCWKALSFAVESGYLLETMSKTDYLTERQSMPLRTACDNLQVMIYDAIRERDNKKSMR